MWAGNVDMALRGFNRKIRRSRHVRRFNMFYRKLPFFRKKACQWASLMLESKQTKVTYSLPKKQQDNQKTT